MDLLFFQELFPAFRSIFFGFTALRHKKDTAFNPG